MHLDTQTHPSDFLCFLIAAQTADGFIARHANELSTRWTSKEDASFYRQKSTEAGVVVMGRSTYETFNKPLPNRVNLVLTRTLPNGIDQVANANTLEKGQVYYTSLSPEKLIEKLAQLGFKQLAVSGGASVYQQFVASGVVTQMWITVEENVRFGEGISLFASDYHLENDMQLVETIDLSPVTKVRHYKKRKQKISMKIKLFDTSLPVPKYQTKGSVAFDLCARETIEIQPHSVAKVPLNIAVELPPGHWALLAPRSSLHKKGVNLANGIGVGDADFCGENDEYQAALLNFTDQPTTIERGERIVQMIILPYARVELEVVEHLGNTDRGGFGSTG